VFTYAPCSRPVNTDKRGWMRVFAGHRPCSRALVDTAREHGPCGRAEYTAVHSLNTGILASPLLGRIARTTYVDVAYCYRPSSMICQSVCRSVCHTSEPCKTAEPFVMPFGYGLGWDPRIMSCIDGQQIRVGRPVVKYSDTLP